MYPMNVKRAWGVIRGLIHIYVSEALSQPTYCNLALLQFYSYQVKAGDTPLFQTQSTNCHPLCKLCRTLTERGSAESKL